MSVPPAEINKTFNHTYLVDAARVGLFQEHFPLSEADFLKIKSGIGWASWPDRVFFSSLILFISLISKRIAGFKTEEFEWWTLLIAVGVGILLLLCWLFSPRRDVLKRIKAHYDQNRPILATFEDRTAGRR